MTESVIKDTSWIDTLQVKDLVKLGDVRYSFMGEKDGEYDLYSRSTKLTRQQMEDWCSPVSPEFKAKRIILISKEEKEIVIDDYVELLTPFMSDLKSEIQGFDRTFDFDFAIKNLIKKFENQRKTIAYYQEKYPKD